MYLFIQQSYAWSQYEVIILFPNRTAISRWNLLHYTLLFTKGREFVTLLQKRKAQLKCPVPETPAQELRPRVGMNKVQLVLD